MGLLHPLFTMRVVSILAMLGLGLVLALPQNKEQDKGQQGQNLDDKGDCAPDQVQIKCDHHPERPNATECCESGQICGCSQSYVNGIVCECHKNYTKAEMERIMNKKDNLPTNPKKRAEVLKKIQDFSKKDKKKSRYRRSTQEKEKKKKGTEGSAEKGPNQDNKVKLEPSFDAVKEAAENELEEGRDNKLEQDPVFDAVKDAQEPKKCAKDGEGCCHSIQDGVSDLNRSKIEDMIKEAKEDKEAFEKKSESCKKRGKLDCCEGYYCAVTAFSNCRSIP